MGQVQSANQYNHNYYEDHQTYHSCCIDIDWGIVARIGGVVLSVIGSIVLNALLGVFAPPIAAAILGPLIAGIAIVIIRICFFPPCN